MLGPATFSPISLPIAQIQTQWSGDTITDLDYDSIKPNAFFTLPFLLFNFLPEISLRKAEVLQFWLGFQFLTANLSLNAKQLHQAFQRMQFQFLAVINSQTKNCLIKRNLSKAQQIEVRNLGKYLEEPEYTDVKNSPYHFNFLFSQPFLIPTRCLNKEQKNTLLLSWTPQDDSRFTKKTAKIRLDFLLPRRWEANRLTLLPNQKLTFSLPALTWLRFRLGKTPLIDTLANHQFQLHSELKESYPFLTPFDGLFALEIKPWVRTRFLNDLMLVSRNLFRWFEDWFILLQFNFSFLTVPEITTIVKKQAKLANRLRGKLRFHSVRKPNYKLLFEHFFAPEQQKNPHLLPTITNQIHSQALFLTSQTTPHLDLKLVTELILKDKINLALKWVQTVRFLNLWNQAWNFRVPDHFSHNWVLTIFYCLKLSASQLPNTFTRLAGKNCV